MLDGLVFLFTGDIANNGAAEEYEIAANFISRLRTAFKSRYPSLTAHVILVSGNHDCTLPEEEVDHRRSEIEMSLKRFNEPSPDKVFIDHLLDVQSYYWEFADQLSLPTEGEYSRLACTRNIPVGNCNLRFNLYNSAALSQREEIRGQIYLPTQLLPKIVPGPLESDIVLSVVHHPLHWLEPDNLLSFRSHLLKSSDFVLTGHQHKRGYYYQQHDTGESLRVYESPALYDRQEREASSFRVLSLDLVDNSMKEQVYSWRDNLYRPLRPEADW